MHFGKSGNQSIILRTLSKILRTLSKILRTLSKKLRTLSKILCTLSKILRTLSKILRILPHTQVGLPLYLANMFKAMKASCRELQAQLEKNGTPIRFPKVLPAKQVEWEHLQSMDLGTLPVLASLWSTLETEQHCGRDM